MEANQNEEKGNGGSLPMLGADCLEQDFRSWFTAMCAVINSLSIDFNLMVDPAPEEALGLVAIAELGNAAQIRIATARREVYGAYRKAQKRAASMLLTAVSKNRNATKILNAEL